MPEMSVENKKRMQRTRSEKISYTNDFVENCQKKVPVVGRYTVHSTEFQIWLCSGVFKQSTRANPLLALIIKPVYMHSIMLNSAVFKTKDLHTSSLANYFSTSKLFQLPMLTKWILSFCFYQQKYAPSSRDEKQQVLGLT